MIVKYKREKYKVRFLDACCIWWLQIKLVYLRILRNLNRFLLDCKSSIILIPMWFLFMLFTYMWGTKTGRVTDIWGVAWELKTSIFTSIILVIFLNVYNGRKSYKVKIEQQFCLYYELLFGFEDIAKAFYQKYTGKEFQKEGIFYTWERYHEFSECIEKCTRKEKSMESAEKEIKNMILLLGQLQDVVKNNGIISWNKESYRRDHNQYILSIISDLLINLNSYDSEKKEFSKKTLQMIILHMYCLIGACSIPWRRDEKIDSKIRSLIAKDNRDKLCQDYYIRLFFNE